MFGESTNKIIIKQKPFKGLVIEENGEEVGEIVCKSLFSLFFRKKYTVKYKDHTFEIERGLLSSKINGITAKWTLKKIEINGEQYDSRMEDPYIIYEGDDFKIRINLVEKTIPIIWMVKKGYAKYAEIEFKSIEGLKKALCIFSLYCLKV